MLPRECFLNQRGETQISEESSEFFQVKEIKADNGVFVYVEGATYPLKGFPTAENIFAMNMVKAILMGSIKLFGVFILFLNKQKLIDEFNRIAWKILSPHILKDRYLLPATKALQFTVFNFVYKMGIKEESADRFASIFVHLIENDNAYRLRVAHIFTMLSQGLTLKQIHKEVSLRDKNTHSQRIIRLLRLALLVPKIRKSYNYAIQNSDLETIALDESDKYWCAIRTDYDFKIEKNPEWIYPTKI
jgi:hypothetical protein